MLDKELYIDNDVVDDDSYLDYCFREFLRIGKKLDNPRVDWTSPYI